LQWSTKQKRAYHRVKSGVRLSSLLNIPIQHWVLTTSNQGKHRNLSSDYQALRKRVKRKFGIDLSYFCVRTNEGNGVLHLVIRNKSFIPQRWLSKQWSEIHQSPYVYIKRPPKHIANYVVSQYVSAQDSSYQRCSWSQSWVCQGFVKIWNDIKQENKDYSKCKWNNYNGQFYYSTDFDKSLKKWDAFIQKLAFVDNYDYWKEKNKTTIMVTLDDYLINTESGLIPPPVIKP
jgi:hypothetical protein